MSNTNRIASNPGFDPDGLWSGDSTQETTDVDRTTGPSSHGLADTPSSQRPGDR